MAFIKAAEYGLLGGLIGWIGQQPWGNGKAHAAAGLSVGLVFGCLVLYLAIQGPAQPPATAALVSKGINEILFPMGCSLVLFAANALSKKH